MTGNAFAQNFTCQVKSVNLLMGKYPPSSYSKDNYKNNFHLLTFCYVTRHCRCILSNPHELSGILILQYRKLDFAKKKPKTAVLVGSRAKIET